MLNETFVHNIMIGLQLQETHPWVTGSVLNVNYHKMTSVCHVMSHVTIVRYLRRNACRCHCILMSGKHQSSSSYFTGDVTQSTVQLSDGQMQLSVNVKCLSKHSYLPCLLSKQTLPDRLQCRFPNEVDWFSVLKGIVFVCRVDAGAKVLIVFNFL